MTTPKVVADATAKSKEFYVTVSAENADEFADVDIFIIYGDAEGKTLKTIQADKLMSQIPAFARGSVVTWWTRPRWPPRPTRRRCRSTGGSTSTSSCSPTPSTRPRDRNQHPHSAAGRRHRAASERRLSADLVRRRAGGAALIALASIAFGARLVGWQEIVSAFSGEEAGIAQAAVQKRIPRTMLALLIGAALGLSGAVMQGVTRNPLADPGILGVTNGAALAVVTGHRVLRSDLADVVHLGGHRRGGRARRSSSTPSARSAGAGRPRSSSPWPARRRAAAFSSLVSAILLPRIDVMNAFRFWQIGGVGGASFGSISLVLPFLVVGAVICFVSARGLNSLALGEEVAAGLGERVAVTRLVAAAGAVLLCGAATAVAGPIGFVGLVVPHLCRLLVGIDHRWLLPFSMLVGAILLTAADVVGRVVARPAEVDVGIITALVGAPFFIYIVRRQKVRAL